MKSVVHEMDLNKNNQEHFPEYQRVNLQTSCKQRNKDVILIDDFYLSVTKIFC